MNAIYGLGARLRITSKWGKETLKGGERNNRQFSDFSGENQPLAADRPLTKFSSGDTVLTPRVLKDGADSVGGMAAFNRVFVTIGLFSEEWLLPFMPLIGGSKITPFPIATAEKNSVYWNATTEQTPDTALFFLAASPGDPP